MSNEHVRVLIHHADETVSVMQFLTKARIMGEPSLDHWEPSEDDGFMQREASAENIGDEIKRSNIDCVSFEIITEDMLPTDRVFRAAWTKCPKNKIKVDMDKACAIHMDRIRYARNQRLEELDKRKYGSEYDTERQKLRDIPATFNLSKASTPDELKNLWPEELKQ